MSLICFLALGIIAPNVDVLYDDKYDTGHLWMKNGSLPACSSTSPPSPSSCEVCLQQEVYAVCRDLMQDADLRMEAAGQPITIKKSKCPWLLGDATVQSATEYPLSTIQRTDSAGTNPGTWEWWQIFIPILFLLLFVFMVFYIRKKRSNKTDTSYCCSCCPERRR
ncbi:uncharacterized protein LOC122989328 isoform X2 [Scomber scombrus]|uniref:Uncharacterized protein LOC122989328 isoform X2 n=1 Tax=Scomber scombrus TaxID=13677 RepID=A0AAV1QA66_SCOSC